jgi:hypothetical protein
MKTGDDERRLWLSVIRRAQEEAEGVPSFSGMPKVWIRHARRWLTSEKLGQMQKTCLFAGLSSEQFKDLRRRAIKQYGIVGRKKK